MRLNGSILGWLAAARLGEEGRPPAEKFLEQMRKLGHKMRRVGTSAFRARLQVLAGLATGRRAWRTAPPFYGDLRRVQRGSPTTMFCQLSAGIER